ncbi:alpha/beta hydrolase [Roseomonas sp. BN140053]|uniref:alpha/beta hydrolase n=1 Tax=Roseomonas sp. BN140053 TaxID=3391898 RepID=UPI0039EA1772
MPTPFRRGASTAAALLAIVAPLAAARAQQPAGLAPREVPAHSLPVPTTVSPEMQRIIAMPLRPGWNTPPTTAEGWRAAQEAGAAAARQALPALAQRLRVRVEPTVIAGVKAYTITPETIPPENRERLLVHVHGGCYVLNPAEAALGEAIFMAGLGGFRVISVDYRMPPEAYFPAALDDVVAVWKATAANTDPRNMAIFGSSAGGALTLEAVLRAKAEGLPLPAAIAPGTPMADVSGPGDSFRTNALVDNVLVSPDGFCDAATRFYADGHDLSDPLLSPVYGDLRNFPPTILTTGTRDLLLSNTVRMHRGLRQAGVEAVLQVYEGQSHAQFYRDDTAPETREAFAEIAGFFNKHLGR